MPAHHGSALQHLEAFCDHAPDEPDLSACAASLALDVEAPTFEAALPFLLAHGRREGWSISDDGETVYCPDHWSPAPLPADETATAGGAA